MQNFFDNISKTAKSSKWSVAAIVIMLTAVVIRVMQNFYGTSFWKDELFSTINIERMTMWELITQQPEYNQVASVGYYIIQKSMVILFGGPLEITLRIYPMLCSIVSIYLFYLIASRFFSGFKLVSLLLLIAFSVSSVWTGIQAKPYAGDICFILFFVWFLIRAQEKPFSKSSLWWLGLAGFAGAISTLSGTVFVFAAVAFLIWRRNEKITVNDLIPAFTLWISGALLNLAYTQLVISSEVAGGMSQFWQEGFPAYTGIVDFIAFYFIVINNVIGTFVLKFAPSTIQHVVSISLFVLAGLGGFYLARKNITHFAILILPVLMGLALATVHLLPFRDRLGFYAVPPLLIMAFFSFKLFEENVGLIKPWLTSTVAILLAFPCTALIGLAFYNGPIDFEPTKKILLQVKNERGEEDILYASEGADLSVEYYSDQIDFGPYVQGEVHQTRKELARELEQFEGEPRVWLYYTGERENDAVRIRDYLDVFESKAEEVKRIQRDNSAAVLYDFSSEDSTAEQPKR